MSSFHIDAITADHIRMIRKVTKERDEGDRPRPDTVVNVLYYLAKWAKGPSDLVNQTTGQIADFLGVSTRVVERSLAVLEVAGLIETRTHGGSKAKRGSIRRLEYAFEHRPVENDELPPGTGGSSDSNSRQYSANSRQYSANSRQVLADSATTSALYQLADPAADPLELPNPYGWRSEDFQRLMTRYPGVAEREACPFGCTADELLERIVEWESSIGSADD